MSDLVVVMNAGRIEQVGDPSTSTGGRARRSSPVHRPDEPAERVRRPATARSSSPAAPSTSRATPTPPATWSSRCDRRTRTSSWATRPERNALPGTVVFVRDLGELFECYVDCGLDEQRDRRGLARGTGARPAGRSGWRFAFPAEACVVVSGGERSVSDRPTAKTPTAVLAFPVAMLLIFFLDPVRDHDRDSLLSPRSGRVLRPRRSSSRSWQRLFQPVFLERALFSIGISPAGRRSCASRSRSRSRTS